MERAKPPKIGPGEIEIKDRESELQSNHQAAEKPNQPPEDRGNNSGFHNLVIIAGLRGFKSFWVGKGIVMTPD